MGKIGVIANGRARFHAKNPKSVDEIRAALGDHGYVFETREVGDLVGAAQRFKDDGVDLIAISGGDGTTSVTLGKLLEIYPTGELPPIVLLTSGTMNTVARSMGTARGRPARLTKALVEQRQAGKDFEIVERTLMRVEGRLCFLFGCGVLVRFLEAYYRDGAGQPTPLTAVRTLSRLLGSTLVGGSTARRMVERIDVDITVDSEVWPRTSYTAIAAGTVMEIGLGFRPFYRALEKKGTFHLLGIHLSPGRFALQLPNIYRAQPIRSDGVRDGLASSAILTTPEGRLAYMADGDIYEVEGPLRLEAGPSVRFALLRTSTNSG